MWTDSHCHLDSMGLSFWQAATQSDVTRVVVPGISGITDEALSLAAADKRVRAAAGWHPLFPPEEPDQVGQLLSDILDQHPSITIVGEIGLDYWYPETDRLRQQAMLKQQLNVASERGLPTIIHLRKAWEDFTAIVEDFAKTHFIMHMYGGSAEQARQLMDRLPRVWFSFGGPAIRKNATRTHKTIRSIPREQILLETDAPDLPPPGTTQPNTPANLPIIGAAIARILELSPDELARITSANATEAFQWTDGNG